MSRDNFAYLGINEGPQDRLVLAWFISSEESNCFMLTVRSLERIVGQKEVAQYHIAADPSRNFGFILCPDAGKADFFL